MLVLSPFSSQLSIFLHFPNVLVLRNIAGLLYQDFLFVSLGDVKILILRFFFLAVSTVFQVIFVDVRCVYDMFMVLFLTLPGLFFLEETLNINSFLIYIYIYF